MGWGYAGEVWDGALGMYELRARQYRPTTGRFWTMDRFEGRSRESLSIHKYLYCHDNPVNMLDPSGHMSLSDVYYSMGARVYLASARMAAYPGAVGIAKATVAAVTVGSLILSDEARVAYLATGNPAAVAASLADDVGVLLYRGGSAIQRVGSSMARLGVLNKLEQPLAASARQIRSIASDAMVGFRGSLATGVKHSTGGPFDPTDFDLDAFIVSDKLARQTSGRFRDGNNIPGVAAEADKIQKQLQSFSGHRSDKPFTFRIWTTEEYERIVKEGPHVIQ